MELREYCLDVARRAQQASWELARVVGERKQAWLHCSAELLLERSDDLLIANQQDLSLAPSFGLSAAQVDRLRLSEQTIDSMARAMVDVAALPDPVGEVIESSVRPNGLEVLKVRVPLGVVFFIFESRPNVTSDASAIAVKSGNAIILRGGKEAFHSNLAVVQVLREALAETGLPSDAVQLVTTPEREAVGEFLALDQYINVAIPRGGESLIRRVADEARMPVIKHFTGNCHVYVDAAADLEMAERIVVNAKCQRMGVCNAAESLLVHSARAEAFLPKIGAALRARGIELRADPRACQWLGAWFVPLSWRVSLPVAGGGHPRHRGRLSYGVSGTGDFDQSRRFPGRGHPAHRSLWLPPHRRHRHRRSGQRAGICPARG